MTTTQTIDKDIHDLNLMLRAFGEHTLSAQFNATHLDYALSKSGLPYKSAAVLKQMNGILDMGMTTPVKDLFKTLEALNQEAELSNNILDTNNRIAHIDLSVSKRLETIIEQEMLRLRYEKDIQADRHIFKRYAPAGALAFMMGTIALSIKTGENLGETVIFTPIMGFVGYIFTALVLGITSVSLNNSKASISQETAGQYESKIRDDLMQDYSASLAIQTKKRDTHTMTVTKPALTHLMRITP